MSALVSWQTLVCGDALAGIPTSNLKMNQIFPFENVAFLPVSQQTLVYGDVLAGTQSSNLKMNQIYFFGGLCLVSVLLWTPTFLPLLPEIVPLLQ